MNSMYKFTITAYIYFGRLKKNLSIEIIHYVTFFLLNIKIIL